jgi:imidazoleglycerol phosphate dehydratase HisB
MHKGNILHLQSKIIKLSCHSITTKYLFYNPLNPADIHANVDISPRDIMETTGNNPRIQFQPAQSHLVPHTSAGFLHHPENTVHLR